MEQPKEHDYILLEEHVTRTEDDSVACRTDTQGRTRGSLQVGVCLHKNNALEYVRDVEWIRWCK